jgi:katanin p60 ATPase-containing subunit A1
MTVDLSASIYAEYVRACRRAEEAERHGKMREVIAAYHKAAELMRKYSEYGLDAEVRKQRLEKADAYEQSAAKIEAKQHLASPQKLKSRGLDGYASEHADDYEAEVMALIQQTQIRWKDIGGLEESKSAIKSSYALAVANKPEGVEIHGWRNILMYGPPGTGKTLLAAAAAGSLEATFFNVKVSNLLSKYFGETTKLITALYTLARKLSPAVIFLDEFEALTPPRGSGESGAERRIVSTLLTELDGLASKDDDHFVMTMVATNLPWLLDLAILSRFQKRIYVTLPDDQAREAILCLQLTRRGHKTAVSVNDLILRTRGYSGREIEQLCQTAITNMVQRRNRDLLTVVDLGQAEVRKYNILVEPISDIDFAVAFEQVKPIADTSMLLKYSEWGNLENA